MRIVVHGQQAFGKAVLEALLERGEDVVAVYAPPEGGRPDPLAEAAEAAGLPLVRPASFKDPAVLEEFRALEPDLQVMAFVTLIVPAEFLSVPTHGTIQYHPSLLPLHRGRSAINWPVIKGETETGLTVFWPDGGIDTGDVLLQRRTPISATDTLGSLYFDRLFPMGVDALVDAVGLVQGRDGAPAAAGRVSGHLRGAVREGERAHRLGQAVPAAPRPGARLRPGARAPGRRAAARCCRSSPPSRCRRATPPASAVRWERSWRSGPAASAWSAPTAACG